MTTSSGSTTALAFAGVALLLVLASLADAAPAQPAASTALLGGAAAGSSSSSSSFFSSWQQQDLDLLGGTHREEVNIVLAIVGSSMLTTFFILGCVSKKSSSLVKPGNDDATAVEFGVGSAGSPLYLNMVKDVLDAAYSVLGQRVMLVADAQAELDAAKETLEGYEARDEASFSGSSSKDQYVDYFKVSVVAPAETALGKATASFEESKTDLTKLRAEAGAVAAPAAKQSTKAYSDTFAKAVQIEPEEADAYATRLKAAQKTLPKAVDGDGKKTARQTAAQEEKDNADNDGADAESSKHKPSTIRSFQKAGVACAMTFFALVKAAVVADSSLTKDDLRVFESESKVATAFKAVDRLMEKAYGRHGGDASFVTDFGRMTFTAATLRVLLAVFNAIADICSAGGGGDGDDSGGGQYTLLRIKNLLDTTIADDTVAANSGYRNTNLLLRDNDGGQHVFEVQLNLQSLERVKNGPLGHKVFEVLRKLGYSAANSVASGAMTPLALRGVETGRIMDLEFRAVSWTEASAKMLQDALSSRGCRVLKVVVGAAQGDTVALAHAVAAGLKVNDSVTNQLGEAAGAALGEALKTNSTLTSINLGGNSGIPAETKKAIKAAAAKNKAASKYGMDVLLLKEDAGAAIATLIKSNDSKVTELDLSGLDLGEADGAALSVVLEALKTNSTNQLGEAAGAALGEALKTNSTLTSINLGSNSGIPAETRKAIKAAVAKNKAASN
eukprot:gene15735-25429_t